MHFLHTLLSGSESQRDERRCDSFRYDFLFFMRATNIFYEWKSAESQRDEKPTG